MTVIAPFRYVGLLWAVLLGARRQRSQHANDTHDTA